MSYKTTAELKAAIERLEEQKKIQQQDLIHQFHATKESLKPGNLIKSAWSNIDGKGIIGTALKTAGAVGASLIAGKITGAGAAVQGGKGLLGMVLKQAASVGLLNNRDKIKAYGTAIFSNLFSKKDKPA